MKRTKAKAPREIAPILKLRNQQRKLIHEEIFLLACFMDEWYWQTQEVKVNEQYKDPEFILRRWRLTRNKVLGGPGYGDGYLQRAINARMDDVLVRLRQDFPYLSDSDYFAYSYFVAGFDNRTVAHLTGLPSDKMASAVKSRLKDELLKLHSPHKFEYLEILPYLPAWKLPF